MNKYVILVYQRMKLNAGSVGHCSYCHNVCACMYGPGGFVQTWHWLFLHIKWCLLHTGTGKGSKHLTIACRCVCMSVCMCVDVFGAPKAPLYCFQF